MASLRFLLLIALLMPGIAQARKSASFAAGALGVSKPLEVKGQNRSLAMLTAGGADKTKIGFVKPRKDFRPQILSTRY